MASPSTSVQQLAASLVAYSKSLINNDLKKICKEEGSLVSGTKVILQDRVQKLIQAAAERNDAEALQRLRYRIHNHGDAPADSARSSTAFPQYSSPTAAPSPQMNGYGSHNQNYSAYQQQPMVSRPRTVFKDSPFYDIRDLLLTNTTLEVSPSHRQSTSRTIQLSSDVCARMKADPNLRLLLFSAHEEGLGPYVRHDVAFPSQLEVKINGDEVKANFKGLKNKAGSTRPADITDFVRKVAQYRNTLVITYALTQKASQKKQKYNIYVYLVKKHTTQDLIQRITSRSVITKQQVINEMLKKASDPDIVFGSVNMSLKDPVSYSRITTPCRSNLCNHNQCFDIESFLLLQEQAPTWTCPVCNKVVSFEGLAVDQYVQEILERVSKDTEQVTIQPDGKWTVANKGDNNTPQRNGNSGAGDDDSDDDLVEISDYRVNAIKSEATHTPLSMMVRTPPLSSREASTAPRTGSKRTSEVIDLTFSDDDEPVRPTKKVAYSTPNSLPESSHGYPSYGASSAPMRSQPLAPPDPQTQHQDTAPSAVRLNFRAPGHYHSPSGAYRPSLPRPSYSQGTGSYHSFSQSP